jgi:hypothetical protein
MTERQNRLPMTRGASCKLAALVVVLLLVGGQVAAQETIREKSGPAPEQTTVPPANSDAASQGSPTAPRGSGIILVSKKPIKLLAGPSSSAAVMYGIPAGRRFRLIDQESGFAQIQDVKSGAKGWIDETALGQSPAVPIATAQSQPKPDVRPSAEVTATTLSDPTPTPHTHTKKIALMPSKSKHPHKAATAETKPATSASEQSPSAAAYSGCGATTLRAYFSERDFYTPRVRVISGRWFGAASS